MSSPMVYTLDRPGLRSRLDALKSRSISKLHSTQGQVSERAKSTITKVQGSMRTSPMKWAGVAAGSGLAIGLLGRILQARRNRFSGRPLIVIESTC